MTFEVQGVRMFAIGYDMILHVFKTNFPASQAKGSELCVFMKDFKEDPLELFSIGLYQIKQPIGLY